MPDSELSSPGSGERIKELQAALEESSTHNGRLLLAFVLFQFYLLLTVAGTTDLQLLLPESIVKLPLLDVELPLFGFYWVAPILLVILHLNLMIQLLQHSRKLYQWNDERRGRGKELLPAFLFNYFILFWPKTLNDYLVRFLSWITLFFSPLAILLFFQVRFADYHHLLTTTWHFILACSDLLVLLIYGYRIAHPELLDEEYDKFVPLIKHYFANNGLIRLRIFKKTPEGRKLFSIPAKSIHPLYVILSWLFPIVSAGFVLLLILLKQDIFDRSIVDKWYYPLVPKIGVQEQILVASPPSEAIIQAYLMKDKNLDSLWLNHSSGINLRNRNLRFADLNRSKLWNADMRNVNLTGANLERTIFNSANLDSSQLNGANLHSAQLNSAVLKNAQLNGADLGEAQLNGAQLRDAKLNGANLWETQLNGADLRFAQLNGAVLRFAQLNGADLGEAQLNGAQLRDAKLNGADLRETQLNGAELGSAELRGVHVERTQLHGSRGGGGIIGGLYFVTYIDTVSSPDWEVLQEKAALIPDTALYRIYQNRLKRAEMNKSVFPIYWPSQKDSSGFVRVRTDLACRNTYIAEGLLQQKLANWIFTLQVQTLLIDEMRQNCPDSLKVIRKRTQDQELAERIDKLVGQSGK